MSLLRWARVELGASVDLEDKTLAASRVAHKTWFACPMKIEESGRRLIQGKLARSNDEDVMLWLRGS